MQFNTAGFYLGFAWAFVKFKIVYALMQFPIERDQIYNKCPICYEDMPNEFIKKLTKNFNADITFSQY